MQVVMCNLCLYPQDAETVERLNESGELRQLLRPYKVSGANS